MLYLFEIPEICDKVEIQNILKKESANTQQLSFLSDVQDLRSDFKKIVSEQSIQRIQYGESMMNYQQKLQAYLKTNVDLMCMLATQPTFVASFEYKTFLSKNLKKYKTSENNEEACACEIVFARYGYAFLFFLDAFQHIKFIRSTIQSTFFADKSTCEQYLNEIQKAIYKFQLGLDPLQKLYKVMPEVLQSLIKKKKDLIAETKGEVICAVKLVLEVNKYSLELEQFRIEKKFKELTETAKKCFLKLKQAESCLLPEKELIQQDLLSFCKFGQYYYKIYALWSLLKLNLYTISVENYGKKNYIELTLENLAIAKHLVNQKQVFNGMKIEDDYFYFCRNYFNSVFLIDAQNLLNKGNYIQQSDKYQEPAPDNIFEQIQIPDQQSSFFF